jgi:NAD(P)-dependent dehydrogenase (short-subunit alcohol dehydrogenase family)
MLRERVALVTGGSTGIGRATALAFAAAGARVAIASRREDPGREVVRLIEAGGGEALWIRADVAQACDVEAMVEAVMAHFGRLDVAFNNAGSGGRGGWLAEIEEEDWDQTIDGYLKSVWLCMKYEIRAMLRAGEGMESPAGGWAIVNNSSVDGKRAFPPDPIYSAAKHGVLGLTKSAGVQYASRGIRINAVCPGWIRTPPVEEMLAEQPALEGQWLMHQPIGRLGTPEEVAQAVVWLCSPQASLVTATALAVDGGYLAV